MSRNNFSQNSYSSKRSKNNDPYSEPRNADEYNQRKSSYREDNSTLEAARTQRDRDNKRFSNASNSRYESDGRYGNSEEEDYRNGSRSRYGLYSRNRDYSPTSREKASPEYYSKRNGRDRDYSPVRRRSDKYQGSRSRRSSSAESRNAFRRNERRSVEYGDINSDEGRSKSGREKSHEPEFPSRYFYNQESGLWFDQETGTYSYYDETLGGYLPWEETSHGDASLRLVIIESEVLEAQKLVIVDSDGLTVGRDRGTDKRLRLAEMYTSKFHANIYLQALPMDNLEFINSERLDESLAYIFCIVDCGSQHGTFVNETRLSESKVASQPFILNHLDLIKIGTTTMQVHQHASGLVCDSCGTTGTNVVDLAPVQPTPVEPQPVTLQGANKREALEAARKQELRRLKRQYGGSKGGQSEYTDRAALRRQTQPDSPPATVASEIYVPPNHGEKLLMKHGWERGQGLGSQGQGIVEPIALQGSDNRMGLGYGQSSATPAQQETLQQATRRIYRQRFHEL